MVTLNWHKNSKEDVDVCINFNINGKILHYPTLKTLLLVEQALKNAKNPINKAEIKRQLKTKIMHQTLSIILYYLEERGMIIKTENGFVWVYNPSKKLDKAIKEAREI